jgi:hypothetical protein
MRNSYKILVRNYEGMNPVEKPVHTSEDNTKIDLHLLSTYLSDWIELSHSKIQLLAVMNTAVNFLLE